MCRKRIDSLGAANCTVAGDYREITDDPEIDWVMVFSPNFRHCEHIVAALEKGKHVFAEKPLATTIGDCRRILAAAERSRTLFCTGFVLRYAPLYRKVKALLDGGAVGRLIAMEANLAQSLRPFL